MKKVDWTYCWDCGAKPGQECSEDCKGGKAKMDRMIFEVFLNNWAFLVRVDVPTDTEARELLADYFPTATLVRPFHGMTSKVQVVIHPN